MSNLNSPRAHNFRPDDYNAPQVKLGADGKYNLTDYQAALTVRSWMHKNMPGQMISGATLHEVLGQTGPGPAYINVNGKLVELSEQERAAFLKFSDKNSALFRRLDGGENGTHDHLMGAWDIDAAIRNGRLHGAAQHSDKGYWRNRNNEMPIAKAGDVLDDFLSDKFGSNWKITQKDLRSIADAHGIWIPSGDGKTNNFMPIDDPNIIRAAGVLLDNWAEIHSGGGKGGRTLTRDDLQKLTSL